MRLKCRILWAKI